MTHDKRLYLAGNLLSIIVIVCALLVVACSSNTGNNSTPAGNNTQLPPEPTLPAQSPAPTQTTVTPAVQLLKDISVAEANALIEKNRGNAAFVLIDIQTPEEYQAGHLANAILIDYYSPLFSALLSSLDKTKAYLLYCNTGQRTKDALDIMGKLGFREVYHMLGGITAWKGAGYAIVAPGQVAASPSPIPTPVSTPSPRPSPSPKPSPTPTPTPTPAPA